MAFLQILVVVYFYFGDYSIHIKNKLLLFHFRSVC